MRVSELIKELEALPNKDIEILVNVRTETQAYGVAQVSPWAVDQTYGGAAIHVTLPAGMYVARKKGGAA